jgi:hypothetical protein
MGMCRQYPGWMLLESHESFRRVMFNNLATEKNKISRNITCKKHMFTYAAFSRYKTLLAAMSYLFSVALVYCLEL